MSVRVVPPLNDNDYDDDAAPGPLLTALREEDGDFDFSMTNPPFFESTDEVSEQLEGQERQTERQTETRR